MPGPRQPSPPRWTHRLSIWILALGLSACGKEVFLGSLGDGPGSGGSGGAGGNGDVLWRATFETGDLSEWLGDGGGGTYTDGVTAAPIASRTAARTGQWGGAVSFTSLTPTAWSYLLRNQPSPPEAYYSAWIYLPDTFEIGSWLSVLHFGYSRTGDGNNIGPVWDFNIYPTADGTLIAHLHEASAVANREPTNPIPVRMATWVHFEIFYKKAPDATGRIAIWQDGTQILDLPNVVTAPNAWTEWDVGGASNDVTPAATVYFDDVAISLSRLGPQG
jgi:hypothetical protein